MNSGWQLAVVDYSLFREALEHRHCTAALTRFDSERAMYAGNPDFLNDGDVVYIISVQTVTRRYGEIEEMNVAKIWEYGRSRYNEAPLRMLRPVLTDKDAVNVELKFNVSLAEHMRQANACAQR